MADLSVYVVARNEENFIEKCIKSAWATGADEVIVGDNCSVDNTKRIALDNGAKVVDIGENDYPLYGYSHIYNMLADICKNDWVFNLPGDCYVQNPNAVKQLTDSRHYYYWVDFYRYIGEELKHDFHHGRLYNKKKCRYSRDLLHENLYTPANTQGNLVDIFLMPRNSTINIVAQDNGERGEKWSCLMHWLLFRSVAEADKIHFLNNYWVSYYKQNKKKVHEDAARIRELYPSLPQLPCELKL